MTFDRAYNILSSPEVEGGFSNRNLRDDPGGMTKYGISQRAYPDEDIRNLTLERAKFLTRRDYWDAVLGDFLPWPLALCTFDMAFNSGIVPAKKMLQQVLKVTPDGVIGPITLEAAKKADYKKAVIEFSFRRFAFMYSLRNWNANKNGWIRRLFIIAVHAVT